MTGLLAPLLALPAALSFAVLIGGVLAATGQISLPILLAVVVLAAVGGDSVGYEVGRHFGPRVLASPLLRRHQSRISATQGFLRRRGGWAVFLGRFTAFSRAVTPGLAGASGMPYPRFLAAALYLWHRHRRHGPSGSQRTNRAPAPCSSSSREPP